MRTFWKYQATGNDFIFTNTIPNNPSRLAQRMCDRHFGIGADGFMYAEASAVADVKMHYYNSDGSRAKMCGNGLRCFVRFLDDLGQVSQSSIAVETDAGVIRVEFDAEHVHLYLPFEDQVFSVDEVRLPVAANQPLKLEGLEVYVAKLGTLHAMVMGDHPHQQATIGPMITHHDVFPDGINTNFVSVRSPHRVQVATHERGAGWTLSCGTGVAASVMQAFRLGLVHAQVDVDVPGGQLRVELLDHHIKLSGPAQKVAEGQFMEVEA